MEKTLLLIFILILTAIPISATEPDVFAAEQAALLSTTKNACISEGNQWFNDKCYDCEGTLMEKKEGIVCLNCISGFTLVDGKCQANEQLPSNITLFDRLLRKFFPNNPFLGFIIISGIFFLIIYCFLNRKTLKKKFYEKR